MVELKELLKKPRNEFDKFIVGFTLEEIKKCLNLKEEDLDSTIRTDLEIIKARKRKDPYGDLFLIQKEAEFFKENKLLKQKLDLKDREISLLKGNIKSLNFELGRFIREFVLGNPTSKETQNYLVKLWEYLNPKLQKHLLELSVELKRDKNRLLKELPENQEENKDEKKRDFT